MGLGRRVRDHHQRHHRPGRLPRTSPTRSRSWPTTRIRRRRRQRRRRHHRRPLPRRRPREGRRRAATVSAGDDVGFTITVTNDGPRRRLRRHGRRSAAGRRRGNWSIESQTGGARAPSRVQPSRSRARWLWRSTDRLDSIPSSFTVHIVSDTQPTGELHRRRRSTNTGTADAATASRRTSATTSDSVTVLCPGVTLTQGGRRRRSWTPATPSASRSPSPTSTRVPPAGVWRPTSSSSDASRGDLAWQVAGDSDLPQAPLSRSRPASSPATSATSLRSPRHVRHPR